MANLTPNGWETDDNITAGEQARWARDANGTLCMVDPDNEQQAAYVAQLATDAAGQTVDSLSSGSAFVRLRTGQHLDNRVFHRLGKPLAANIQAGSGITVFGQSGNTPTVEYVQRDGMMGIRITTAVGYYGEVIFPAFSDTIAGGKAAALLHVEDCTSLNAYALYVGDAGYANFYTTSLIVGPDPLGQYNGYHVLAPEPTAFNAHLSSSARWAIGAGSPAFGTTTFTQAKIRITPEPGKSTSVTIFGVWVGHASTAPRICITADDGKLTQYTDMLPILEKYNLRASFAIIGDKVGHAGYMTLAQLQDLVTRGHECVVHGPIGGTGSLQNYNNYADVLQDVIFHRDYLVNNGLAKNGSEKIYVYPQGKLALARGDDTILNALTDAGFVGARVADSSQASKPAGPLFKRQIMMCNIVGHMYNAGDEAGNVANVIARIQSSASQGKNAILMFHDFGSGTPISNIGIQNSNFEQICAAINALENAGTAQNALLSEVVFESLAM